MQIYNNDNEKSIFLLPMKIAVNCRLLLNGKLEGIGWYTLEIVRRMVKNHPEHQFYLLFDRPFDKDFVFAENVIPIILPPQSRHPILWYIWFEFSVSNFLNKKNIDLFFSPDGYLPLRTSVKTILTVHDLNFEHFPKQLPFLTRKYYKYFTPKFCKKAEKIITVSKTSKQDIINQYTIESDKISVIYNGANNKYRPIKTIEKQKIKKRYAAGSDYFYFVGSLHTRKNIINLMKGFNQFITQNNTDFKLLIIGEKMWKNKDIEMELKQLKHKNKILFLGRKEIDELSKITAAATALTFIPHFEGFGIPLAEAMNCHTPIITSNVSCLPEIAGNTAIYVNPNDINSIANAMQEICGNTERKQKLIEECKIRKMKFSWETAADQVWKILASNLDA